MREDRTVANVFRASDLTIGVRLTGCFLAIVVLMIAADAVAVWQLRQLAAHTEMLNDSDQISSTIVRLHLDVSSFSGKVAVLTRSHDSHQFANEAALHRETFLRHVGEAEQLLRSSSEIAQDPLIVSTLKTLKTTLPSQVDSEIELANAGDWPALQLRLTGQLQDLIDLSSSMVERVETRVFRQRAAVNQETDQVRHRLFVIVPLAWLLTLLAAAGLGWNVTRTITVPLDELTTGAQALARGDFRHQVNVGGNDELSVLGKAFNHAAQELNRQFEMTLEARVSERTRIARELHDTLLQSFHGLLLGFQTVFQMLPEHPSEAKAKLGSTIEQAAHAITEGRDAVEGLRDSVAEGNNLGPALSVLGEELAALSTNCRPAFRVVIEGDAQEIHPVLRDEIYKIAAEALRNAFRHADAQQIEVEIRYDDEHFRLRVRDDGRGINPDVLTGPATGKRYGVSGMRERAAIVGGTLVLRSEVNGGTLVELLIPGSTAYGTMRRDPRMSETLQEAEGTK